MSAIILRLTRLLVALLAIPPAVSAHRLNEYLQATIVAIEPKDIRLQMNLSPGADVGDVILAGIDRDLDGVISKEEAAAYAEWLKSELHVRVDERDVELKLTASSFPAPAEFGSGSGIIQMEFSVSAVSLGAGAHRLAVENRHLSTLSVYLFNAAQPKSGSVQITKQKRNENQSAWEIEFTVHDPPTVRPSAG